MGAIDCSSVSTSAGNTSRDSAYMQWYWWNTLCGNPAVMLKPQNPPMLIPESFRRKQLAVAQQSQVTSIWKCSSSFACHVSPIGAAIANERTKLKFKRKTQRVTVWRIWLPEILRLLVTQRILDALSLHLIPLGDVFMLHLLRHIKFYILPTIIPNDNSSFSQGGTCSERSLSRPNQFTFERSHLLSK